MSMGSQSNGVTHWQGVNVKQAHTAWKGKGRKGAIQSITTSNNGVWQNKCPVKCLSNWVGLQMGTVNSTVNGINKGNKERQRLAGLGFTRPPLPHQGWAGGTRWEARQAAWAGLQPSLAGPAHTAQAGAGHQWECHKLAGNMSPTRSNRPFLSTVQTPTAAFYTQSWVKKVIKE